MLVESWGWQEFRNLVENRFAEARLMNPADAPIPLVGNAAALWLESRRSVLQWVVEMMPDDDVPRGESKNG